jgi:tetratricopeptide (TPR) repeat protein
MRAAAAISISQGRNEQALRLADALLARAADDVDALVSRSRALRNLGRHEEAQRAARRAHQLADDDPERFAAAMAMAQALSSDGHRTRAQLWLRRAAQAAPSEAAQAAVARDYRYVRTRNPWRTQLSLGIAPSSNINGGSQHETSLIDLGGLQIEVQNAGNALPLSGTQINAGYATSRRLSESETHRLEAQAHVSGRTYRLSAEAKAQAPDAQGSDYAFVSAGAGLRLLTGDPRMPVEWRAGVERSTYGGDLYADALRLGGARGFALPHGVVRIGLEGEHLLRHDIDEDATALDLSAEMIRKLGGGGSLSLSFGAGVSRSDSAVLNHRTARAGLAYALPEPVLGSDLSLDLSLRWRTHDAYPFSSDGRSDRGTTIGATAVLRDVDFYGFNPTLRVQHGVNDSNLRREDTVETSVSLGIRSAL